MKMRMSVVACGMAAASSLSVAGEARGLGSQRVWPGGVVLYDWTAEAYEAYNDGPSDGNYLHLLIPNSLAVMLSIESATAGLDVPIEFHGYDPVKHAGLGYVLLGMPGEGAAAVERDAGYSPAERDDVLFDEPTNFGELTRRLVGVVGLESELRRSDRGEHVEVLWENVAGPGEDGHVGDGVFDVKDGGVVFGAFDFASATLPRACYGSKNGQPTWEPIGGWGEGVDPCDPDFSRAQLSDGDVATIDAIYASAAEACLADFNADGAVDYFDVAAFLKAYTLESPRADVAGPDGVVDFFDVTAFLAAYGVACDD